MWCGEPAHRVAYPTTSTETVTYQYTIPTTSTSNFERADYTLTRNGSQVASGNIFKLPQKCQEPPFGGSK
jgi:hypothetical protein